MRNGTLALKEIAKDNTRMLSVAGAGTQASKPRRAATSFLVTLISPSHTQLSPSCARRPVHHGCGVPWL